MTDMPDASATASAEASIRDVANPPTAPRIDSSVRIPALDGLRGIAILLVLLAHSVFHTTFQSHPSLNRLLAVGRLSWSGVDLFFVLSGFLIGGILLDHRESPKYFKSFYIRRIYRILPLYFVIVALCWVVSQLSSRGWTPFGQIDSFPGPVPWWSFLIFAQNLSMALAGGFGNGGLGVTWSLAIEEQFYLTLPFVIRKLTPRNLTCLLALVMVGAPILRAWLMHYGSHGAFAVYVLTPCRADALAVGVLCAVMVRNVQIWKYLTAQRRWIYGLSSILGLCLVTITAMGYEVGDRRFYGLEFSVLAFFYGAVLLIAVTGDDKLVLGVFRNQLLMKLGLVAYGTYLLHYICIDFFHFLVTYYSNRPPAVAFIGAYVAGVSVAILAANISWRRFEKPLVQRGRAYDY